MLNCNTNKKFSLTFLSILLFFTFYCKERVIEIERSSIFIYAYPTEGKSPLSVKFYASIAYSDKFEIIWDFGDGSSEKTTVPYVEHTYKVSEETVFVVSATLVTGKSIAKSYTTIKVFPENNTPYISTNKNYVTTPGESLKIKVDGYDPDGDKVICSVDFYSDGVSDFKIQIPGEFPFSPTTSGKFKHTLICTDGYGGYVTDAVYVFSASSITNVYSEVPFDVDDSDGLIVAWNDLVNSEAIVMVNRELKTIYFGQASIRIDLDGDILHSVASAGSGFYYGKYKLDSKSFKFKASFDNGYFPDIFADKGEVMICYYNKGVRDARVKCSYSKDSGETFSEIMTYTYCESCYLQIPFEIHPRICGGGGNFYAVWSDGFGYRVKVFQFKRQLLDVINILRSYPQFSDRELEPFYIPAYLSDVKYVSCATDTKNFYLAFERVIEGEHEVLILQAPILVGASTLKLPDGKVITYDYSGMPDFGAENAKKFKIRNISKSPGIKSEKPEIVVIGNKIYVTWIKGGKVAISSGDETLDFKDFRIIHEGTYGIFTKYGLIWQQPEGIFFVNIDDF